MRGAYVVIYAEDEDAISILRVLHGARKWPPERDQQYADVGACPGFRHAKRFGRIAVIAASNSGAGSGAPTARSAAQ